MFDKVQGWFFSKNKSAFRQNVESFTLLILVAFAIRTVIFGLYKVPTGSMETTLLVGESFVADKLTYWFRAPKHGEIIAFNDPLYEYSDNYFMHLFERYVWGPSNWTKRVIGVPGDHVQGMIEDGKPVVYLNGKKLDEPYINQFPLIQIIVGRDSFDVLQNIYSGRVQIEQRSYDPKFSFADQPFYNLEHKQFYPGPDGKPVLIYPGTPNAHDTFDVTLKEDEYWLMGDNRLGSLDSRRWGPAKGYQIHGKIVFRLFSIDSFESWLILDLIKHPIDFWKRVRWSRFMQFVH